jgi:HD-GYP domain-containing protein (c-di-GMP phosphodiesterase class II)
MSDTQVLLSRIAALRQRLEQAQALGQPEHSEAVDKAAAVPLRPMRSSLAALERRVIAGSCHTALIDRTLKPVTEAAPDAPENRLPRQLTARARRLLEEGRELLGRLKSLAEEPLLQAEESGPLARRFRQTVAMAETALRMVQAYPDAPSAQLRLCEGLEATLQAVAERIRQLRGLVEQRQKHETREATLAGLLAALAEGKAVEASSFHVLAESILADAQDGAPLHVYHAEADQPARYVAGHSLNVAQVAARLVRQDSELRARPLEPVLAALLHDVGMLRLPPALLALRRAWTDAERREMERHTTQGAELVSRFLPGSSLVEAAGHHHERMDGTGYPDGLREMQLSPLVRLLAVCDVYAAMCAPRPHRPALEPRTALTDTLLLAEKSLLDRQHAERLLQLSFYPVGSVVELADGALGVVVATHMGRRDLHTPARPVVALLTSAHGQPLALPRYLDLAHAENQSIVRTLPPEQYRPLLGVQHLEFA